jgi:hypothetical protein
MGNFVGSGQVGTTISGTLDSGFLVNAPYQTNSVGRISDMSITNLSSKIGTGALRYAQNNNVGTLENLTLSGMTSLDMGWNVFNTNVIGLNTYGGGGGVSPYGSIAIVNGGANVFGWRGAGASHEIGLTMVGSQSMVIGGCGIEETAVAIVLGLSVGFATATITGANGSKKLTVSGTLYPPQAATATPIVPGDIIVTSGVNPTLNPAITVVSQDSGTSMEQGVYSLSGADGVTISTAQPIQIRRRWGVSNFHIDGFETEGDGVGIYVQSAGAGIISGVNISGQINQGSTNQYGGVVTNSGNVSSPQCCIYVEIASGLTVQACNFHASTTKAAVQFAPSIATLQRVTFQDVVTNSGIGGTSDSAAFIDNGTGTTLVTNNTTSSSSAILHFAAGTIPGSVVAGVPVYSVTTPGNLPIYSHVSSVNNGAGTVTLAANTNGVANGETIKFCVPSGIAGNVLTIQTTNCTLGRATLVQPAGCFTGAPQGGFAVQGTGVPTGTGTPMVSDQVNGYGPGNGGISYAQYTLIKADGSSVSLNLSARVFTFVGGKRWGMSNLTGLSGINATSKAGIQFINCDTDSSLDMVFADLPGQSGVNIDPGTSVGAQEGMEYTIVDAATGNCSDTACNWGANVTGGGGALRRKVRYNGTSWTVVGK